MSEGSKDRGEGMIDELKGRGKSAWGGLTGDKETQAEGEIEQIKGKVKQGIGDVKDAFADAADRVADDRPTNR